MIGVFEYTHYKSKINDWSLSLSVPLASFNKKHNASNCWRFKVTSIPLILTIVVLVNLRRGVSVIKFSINQSIIGSLIWNSVLILFHELLDFFVIFYFHNAKYSLSSYISWDYPLISDAKVIINFLSAKYFYRFNIKLTFVKKKKMRHCLVAWRII